MVSITNGLSGLIREHGYRDGAAIGFPSGRLTSLAHPACWTALSERLINRVGRMALLGIAACRARRMPGTGPMIPICDDQKYIRARACPGYAPDGAGQAGCWQARQSGP